MSTETAASTVRGPVWTDHALAKWRSERNEVPERDETRAYHESIRVDYPPANADAWGRYHCDGDCVLICTRDLDAQQRLVTLIVTVIDLTDRPQWQQAYVRYQAAYGGGRDA